MHGYAPADFLAKYAGSSVWYAIPLAVAIGVPLYSNTAGVIPIVKVLMEKGMAMANGMAIATESYPASERGRNLGMLASMMAIGSIAGPSIGGIVIGAWGWRASTSRGRCCSSWPSSDSSTASRAWEASRRARPARISRYSCSWPRFLPSSSSSAGGPQTGVRHEPLPQPDVQLVARLFAHLLRGTRLQQGSQSRHRADPDRRGHQVLGHGLRLSFAAMQSLSASPFSAPDSMQSIKCVTQPQTREYSL